MKAFTFAQIATILLVVLGLIIMIIVITTQLQVTNEATSGVTASIKGGVEGIPKTACEITGGSCVEKESCSEGTATKNNFGCGTYDAGAKDKLCCK